MNSKTDKGKKGEELALEYFLRKGYTLVEKNWRHARSEIDLVMMYEDVLVFIEVKYRKTLTFGKPEESVSFHKMNMLKEGIEAYWNLHPHVTSIRLDILSIFVDKKNQDIEYFHIEDVYF